MHNDTDTNTFLGKYVQSCYLNTWNHTFVHIFTKNEPKPYA